MSFDVPRQHLRHEVRRRAGAEGHQLLGIRLGRGPLRIVFFSNNGPFSEEGNQYFGRLDAGGLVFEGPARFRYGLGEDGRIAVNPDGTISVDWWLRDERGDWRPWMKNTFEKS